MRSYIAGNTPFKKIQNFPLNECPRKYPPYIYLSSSRNQSKKSYNKHHSFHQPASPTNPPPLNLFSSDNFRLFNGNRHPTTGYRRPKKPIPMPALPLGSSGDSTTALIQVTSDAHEASFSLVAAAALSAQCCDPIVGRIGIFPSASVAVVGASALGVGA